MIVSSKLRIPDIAAVIQTAVNDRGLSNIDIVLEEEARTTNEELPPPEFADTLLPLSGNIGKGRTFISVLQLGELRHG